LGTSPRPATEGSLAVIRAAIAARSLAARAALIALLFASAARAADAPDLTHVWIDGGIVRAATDPDVYDTQRHALATREVEKIIPDRDDADPWRATNRVWTAITHLTDRRRDARIYGVPIRDTYYNMLRLI